MNTPVPRDPVLYIDCTSTFRGNLNTGVQRVVRALVGESDTFGETLCLESVPICYQFNGFYRLEDARKITLESLGQFTPVEFRHEDLYLCPDAFWTLEMADWYPYLRDRGVSIATLIYDLIPLAHPEFCMEADSLAFESALLKVLEHSDLLPCISRETRRTLLDFCKGRGIPLDVACCPVIPLAPAIKDRTGDMADPSRLPEGDFFLMVGTVEPRRGYAEALREFSVYKMRGGDANLLILGKRGAHADEALKCIAAAGPSVTWLSDATDEELLAAYQRARAVVVASKAEGYGLPVAEGLLLNGLVFANRLPVFGEFAGSLPFYFDVDRQGDLARLLAEAAYLSRQESPLEMGSWNVTARTLASLLTSISRRHGTQLAIELQRNNTEAVRWAHWLYVGRKCDENDLPLWLKYGSASEMFDAMRFEYRKTNGILIADSVKWIFSVLLGRVDLSDDEIHRWIDSCQTVEGLCARLRDVLIENDKNNRKL